MHCNFNVICIITTLVASCHGAQRYKFRIMSSKILLKNLKILVDLKMQTNNGKVISTSL